MAKKSYFSRQSIETIIDETIEYVEIKIALMLIKDLKIDRNELINHLLSKNVINDTLYDYLMNKKRRTSCQAVVKNDNKCGNTSALGSKFCVYHTRNPPLIEYESLRDLKRHGVID